MNYFICTYCKNNLILSTTIKANDIVHAGRIIQRVSLIPAIAVISIMKIDSRSNHIPSDQVVNLKEKM